MRIYLWSPPPTSFSVLFILIFQFEVSQTGTPISFTVVRYNFMSCRNFTAGTKLGQPRPAPDCIMKWWLRCGLSFLIIIKHLRNIKTLLLLLTRCQAPSLLGAVWLDSGRRLLCNFMFSDSFYVEALILKSSLVRWIPNDEGFIQQSCGRHSFIWHQHNWLVRPNRPTKTSLAFNQSKSLDWQVSTLSIAWL